MPGKGKIKEAVKKIKNNRFKRQFARGEEKGTNVYMGRGLGMTTKQEAKKLRKSFNKPQKATGSRASKDRMNKLVNELNVKIGDP